MSAIPHSRHRRHHHDERASVAHAAARLIAEGLTDYRAAKLKAARQLGIPARQSLPDNHEVEVALRTHLALFQADTQLAAQNSLRKAAVRAMRWLAQFSPWLVGSVLEGTANEFSAIELESVGTPAKSLEHFLLGECLEFTIADARLDARIVTCEFEFADTPVSITLFENHAQRQSARPRAHLCHRRVQLDDVLQAFGDKP